MSLIPFLLTLQSQAAPPKSDCGLTPQTVEAFTLQDTNPNSSTYGQAVSLSDHLGEVLVIYWAQAT